MATPESVQLLRLYVNELEDVAPYTDTELEARLDAVNGDVREAAGQIWLEKAAKYAELVDVQEGSSRRSLSKLYEQAIAMAKLYGADDASADIDAKVRPARTRPIVRP